jgi:DNA (cytosine-5)-methyltransferase 1
VRPLLLDLFCGAGGAAVGYHRAGFDVIGVDIAPQPNYPFTFYQADALEFLVAYIKNRATCHQERIRSLFAVTAVNNDGQPFSAIHASPPCQDHSPLRAVAGEHGTAWLLGATRESLVATGLPWVIENVPGAPMRTDYKLCGCMFGLSPLRRERWFETSWRGFDLRSPCSHTGIGMSVTGHGMQGHEYRNGARYTQEDRKRGMGIDWMNRDELAQAIPPAYTQYIGEQLIQALECVA